MFPPAILHASEVSFIVFRFIFRAYKFMLIHSMPFFDKVVLYKPI